MRICSRSKNPEKWKIYEWVTKHNVNANDDMYACVTLHDTNVNDNIYACVALDNAHTCNHIHWAPCTFSQVGCCVFIFTHMHLGSSLSLSCHLHGHPCVCGLFSLILPFYFLLYLPPLFLFLNYMKSEVNLHNSCNESVDASDELLLSTGYEPKAHDFKETSVEPYVQLLDSPPLFSNKVSSADPDYDDAALEDMLHQVHRAQVYHSLREELSVSLSSSSMCDRTGRPVGDRSGRPGEHRSSEAQIRTRLDDQKEQILAECKARISQQRTIQGQLLQQKLEFREAHQRSLTEKEELRKFQSSTFDTMARRRLVEDQNMFLELSGRIQELQNEINGMNDSKEFQDVESIRSGNSHVTSRPVSFPPHPIPEGMLRHSFVTPSRREGPPSIWDTHGISGNVFANPDASSAAPYPQELHQWNSSIEEPLHSSTVEKSERPEQDQDLRCQSGPSAKKSVIFSGGDSSKNYGAEKQRLQISDLHFDQFPDPATPVCWEIRFNTVVCTSSQFPTEAMLWIKEVELVDSVDDLKSSSSIRGISMPNFEVLDARIASALNKIIHNSHLKRRISLEEQKAQKQDRFLRGRQIAYLIYDYFRVTGSPWFCRELCRPVHYQSSKWRYSGNRLKVGRNFIVYDENPTWWHLGRIVQIKNTRVWETQHRIGIVQYGDSSEESWTLLSQIENYGEEKYRGRYTK